MNLILCLNKNELILTNKSSKLIFKPRLLFKFNLLLK